MRKPKKTRIITAEVDSHIAEWLDRSKKKDGVSRTHHVNEAMKAYMGKSTER